MTDRECKARHRDSNRPSPRYWDTFLDTPPNEIDPDNARAVLVPVPYDSTTSWKAGARHGPKAIIDASPHLEDYDLELGRDISRVGIHTEPSIEPHFGAPEAMIGRVEEVVAGLASRDRLIGLLGGEHTIAIGAVKAFKKLYSDLSVLYLDAHADLRDEYMGTKWGHASVARRLSSICQLAAIGVRSISETEHAYAKEAKIPIAFWPSPQSDIDDVVALVLKSLSTHVYVSIDLDVFDPSLMPAVGTPEPGGMGWSEVTRIVRKVAEARQVVGFDVSELSPQEGPSACAYTAAKLTYKLIGYATEPDSKD